VGESLQSGDTFSLWAAKSAADERRLNEAQQELAEELRDV
jgi:hypothetical protein